MLTIRLPERHDTHSRKYMKCILLCFCLLTLLTKVQAQPATQDSLLSLVNQSIEDTNKLKLYKDILYSCDIEDNLKYGELLISLADKLLMRAKGEPERKRVLLYKASAYEEIVYYYRTKGDSIHVFSNYQKCLNIYTQLKDQDGINRCLSTIAAFYDEQGNIPKELEWLQKGLSIAKNSDNRNGIAMWLSRLSMLYLDEGEYEQAISTSERALATYQLQRDTAMMAKTFRSLGEIYAQKKDSLNAEIYFNKAIKLYEAQGDKQGLRLTYNILGLVYARNRDDEKALRYFKKSLSIAEALPDKTYVRAILGNIGDIFRNRGDLKMALDYHHRALVIARGIRQISGQRTSVWFQLAEDYLALRQCHVAKNYVDSFLTAVYSVPGRISGKQDGELLAAQIDSCCGNFKAAFLHHQQYIRWRDKLNSEEVTKLAIKEKFQDEYERKKLEDRAVQGRKDTMAEEQTRRQTLIRNSLMVGLLLVGLFLLTVIRQRNRIRVEQQRSDNLLLNILPAETAAELKNTGSSKARNFNEVTVMFTDFKNFSQASEKLSAEELVHEINYLYSSFDTIISTYHIEKIKTIGDSYMAASGLPVENETHAEDTVRAALDIQQFISNYNDQKSKQGMPCFEIRIGIHTGPVVAGIVGIKKFAYDIWGDTVNIASRMESSGEAGKINISGTTYDIVKDKFTCVYRGKILAKNKGEIDMYFVTAHPLKSV